VKGLVKNKIITKFTSDGNTELNDLLAVEEPMEIRVIYGSENNRKEKSLSVTMRTPGNDMELAVGFLFTESIITSKEDVIEVAYCNTDNDEQNIVKVSLNSHLAFDIDGLTRHFYTTSSCGICGKASIDQVESSACLTLDSEITFNRNQVVSFPDKIKGKQLAFEHTGGIHAAALFNAAGEIVFLREDIGRHNAVDKVIGTALWEGMIPLNDYFIMVSGRAGFELVQKSIIAGIPCLGAIGAPSSLSVELAEKLNMTLLGFIKNDKFNVYAGKHRIKG